MFSVLVYFNLWPIIWLIIGLTLLAGIMWRCERLMALAAVAALKAAGKKVVILAGF
jgi:hypothetical protein